MKSVKSIYTKITKKNFNGKQWVGVQFSNGERTISFEELYYICRWMGECEDEKYPETYHKGRLMVSEFLNDAINGHEPYSTLVKKYKFINFPIMKPSEQRKLF